MDDISNEVGISKKTLYQYVEDKKDLVNKTFASYIQWEEKECTAVCFETENPIDQLFSISSRMSNNLRSMNPALFIDLKKYFPESWIHLERHRKEFIYSRIKENIESGVKQGWYRKDLDIEFVARIYISMIGIILDQDAFPPHEFPFYKLTKNLISYHIHSIASDKGKNYLKKLAHNNA